MFVGDLYSIYLTLCLRFTENDHDTDSALPILNSYNPEYGCAYYFTEHGNKLPLLPGY